MSCLTLQLLADPELRRIAAQARDEVLAEETERIKAQQARMRASPSRFTRSRAQRLYPAITIEMVAERIHELTDVRVRLRRAEAELQRLRAKEAVRS